MYIYFDASIYKSDTSQIKRIKCYIYVEARARRVLESARSYVNIRIKRVEYSLRISRACHSVQSQVFLLASRSLSPAPPEAIRPADGR